MSNMCEQWGLEHEWDAHGRLFALKLRRFCVMFFVSRAKLRVSWIVKLNT